MVIAAHTLPPTEVDLLALDVDDVPVLVVEVETRGLGRQQAALELRALGSRMQARYGALVDRATVRLFDLAADAGEPPIFELPTQALLDCYAHGIDANAVSGRYLTRLADAWLRNIQQPLAASPAPGLDRLRALGLVDSLRDGQTIANLRPYF